MALARTTVADDEPVSGGVVGLLADAEEVEPHALRPPLYDVVDPDALERLFDTGADGRTEPKSVAFHYDGYRVTIRRAGGVVVELEKVPADD